MIAISTTSLPSQQLIIVPRGAARYKHSGTRAENIGQRGGERIGRSEHLEGPLLMSAMRFGVLWDGNLMAQGSPGCARRGAEVRWTPLTARAVVFRPPYFAFGFPSNE
jgi:hypothetical protein